MNIEQESLNGGFVVGHGGADAADKPIVAAAYASKAYKGVRVRAATANTLVIYVGPQGVTVDTGYPLPAGEELSIPIEDPSKVHVTATPAANCQQTVTLAGEIAGESLTLTFQGATTDPIAVDANAAAVKAALEALSTIGAGNVDVTDTAGGPPYTVEFKGTLAKTDVDLMTATDGGINETQTVGIDNGHTGGTFTLTFDGQTTAAIDYNATAGAVQSALEALSSVGAGNAGVTGGPADWVVEFKGTLAATDVALMTGDGSLLTGGANTDVTVTEAQKGDAGFTVTIAKVADITEDSQYSWIAV